MTRIKLPLQLMALSCTFFLAILTTDSQPLQSQSTQSTNNSHKGIQLRFKPPKPPDQGAPGGRRRGGASRGSCQKDEALTALVPVTGKLVWGLTAAERPTFLFFVPEILATELSAEFVLQDEAGNHVVDPPITFTRSEMQPGVVSIPIPLSHMKEPLSVGKLYHWTFSISCDPAKPSASVFVQGSVQRVSLEPALQRQLKAATPRMKVNLYADNGIWHDALTTLADLRRAQPNDPTLVNDWDELLQQVDLEAILQQPIVNCCSLDK